MRGKYSSQLDYNMDIVGLTSYGPLHGYIFGDLNSDGFLDLTDFSIYITNLHSNLSGLTPDEAYARGDLNGDFQNDFRDFSLFRSAYNEADGAGAFEAALANIPEPPPLVMLAIAVLLAAARGNRRRVI
jgi:hypothetical protein